MCIRSSPGIRKNFLNRDKQLGWLVGISGLKYYGVIMQIKSANAGKTFDPGPLAAWYRSLPGLKNVIGLFKTRRLYELLIYSY